MRAAVITAPHVVEIQTVPDPTPGRREVVLRVAGAGICGTDLHILEGDYTPLPVVPGHEFSGEIVAVGQDVVEFEVGDRVAADPSLYCNECYNCRRGRGNLCERYAAIGVTQNGAIAEFVSAPAANCVRLPAETDLADAALIEPLSCVVHAFDVVRARLADHLLIYGAGPMGLLMLQVGQHVGASSIDVVELNPERAAIAGNLGASAVVANADELSRQRGHEVVIDCTGAPPAIEDGISRVAAGGAFLHFGVSNAQARISYNANRVLLNEISIIASAMNLNGYERGAQLFIDGVVDPSQIITHRYPLDQFDQAIHDFKSGTGLKHQIQPNS